MSKKMNDNELKKVSGGVNPMDNFINAGDDLLSSQGFQQAANALNSVPNDPDDPGSGKGGFTPFAGNGGSSMRAESG
jgi:bacteriocin-like protein